MIKIGSLFSGIGGFELGLERAIPNSKTIWQVEQNKFCKKVLQKHWPEARVFDDVKNINAQNVEPIDLLCGGFPCQDISVAGKGKGIYDGKKSSLWWEMLRIIGDLRPRIVVMENVSAITFRGLDDVLGSLSQIGYDAEWEIISARQVGACHLRERWFCVAYPTGFRCNPGGNFEQKHKDYMDKDRKPKEDFKKWKNRISGIDKASFIIADSNESHDKRRAKMGFSMEEEGDPARRGFWRNTGNTTMPRSRNIQSRSYWGKVSGFSPLCGLDDGISKGLDGTRLKLKEKHRKQSLKAFGNAIVPQCSEYIGSCILESGLLEGLK
tara:strand:- start:2151 stop:3122 length:972 start_codon:yes stop_codon:yes gene_type:complete